MLQVTLLLFLLQHTPTSLKLLLMQLWRTNYELEDVSLPPSLPIYYQNECILARYNSPL